MIESSGLYTALCFLEVPEEEKRGGMQRIEEISGSKYGTMQIIRG